MAKYRVEKTSFINNTIVREGEVVEYDGIPGDNLTPLDKQAEKAAAKSVDANVESLVRQHAAATAGDANAASDVAVADAVVAAAEAAASSGNGLV